MLPALIHLGPITIRTYGTMYVIGVLMAIFVSYRLAKSEKIDSNTFFDFVFYLLLTAVLGAKVFLVLTNLEYYIKYPSELKYMLLSGGTFFGGLLFAMIFAVFYFRKKKLSFRLIGDILTPGLALGHFFGRIGCFAAGCCFGRLAPHSPLAVTFSNPIAHEYSGVPLHVPLYPTQLMESLLNLCNFLFLYWLYPRRKFKGQVLVMYLFNYSLIRFAIEYFRGDYDRGFVIGGPGHPFSSLSLPQLLSLVGILLAIFLFFAFKKKGEKENLS